jgi:hypothetical protein
MWNNIEVQEKNKNSSGEKDMASFVCFFLLLFGYLDKGMWPYL